MTSPKYTTFKVALFVFLLGGGLLALLFGESTPQISTYRVPKGSSFRDAASEASDHGPHGPGDGHNHGAPPSQNKKIVQWQVPAGWQEQIARPMTYATFNATPQTESVANVTVSILGAMGGGLLPNINRWRGQLGLAPVGDEETGDFISTLHGQENDFTLVELVSEKSLTEDTMQQRMLVAILQRPEESWFFKLLGDGIAVQDVKADFLSFIESVSFLDVNPPAEIVVKSGDLTWSVPDSWQSVTPGSMAKAAYQSNSSMGGNADITVTSLSGMAGGMEANINRWRGQLGLESLSPIALQESVFMVQAGPFTATVVDFVSAEVMIENRYHKRMMAAIVVQDGSSWFFKLSGSEDAVEAARDGFLSMLASMKVASDDGGGGR